MSESQIDVLPSWPTPVRRRPALYVGDTDVSGLHELIWGLVGRALDLHIARVVTEVHVDITSDSWVTIRDDGPGIPVDTYHVNNKSILETICTELMSGGGYGFAFWYSITYPVVNALSTRFEVETTRDSIRWGLSYDGGVSQSGLRNLGATSGEGTAIRFHPDPAVFRTIEFDLERTEARLQELAWLYPHARVFFQGRRLESRGGLRAWAESSAARRGQLRAVYATHQASDGDFVDVALAWNDSAETDLRSFANTYEMRTGSHLGALWHALADFAMRIGASVRGVKHVREALLPGLVGRVHVVVEEIGPAVAQFVTCSSTICRRRSRETWISASISKRGSDSSGTMD